MSNFEAPMERIVLVCVLKLTKDGPVRRELVGREARVPLETADKVLEKFSALGLLRLTAKTVEASSNQRVKVAIQALELGADPEGVCKALRWGEFEDIAAVAFEANNFTVKRSFRFKWAERRWEIDLLGFREPLIVCADCKHWIRGWRRSAITKVVDAQVERTRALMEAIPSLHEEMGLSYWKRARFIPVILSLVPGPFKFYKGVPVVPVLQLRDFLSELPAYLTELKQISTSL